MNTILNGACVAISLALAACTTVPTEQFHTLRPLGASPPAVAQTPFAGKALDWLAVGPVTVPAALDRAQWVVRRAENRVQVMEQQRWAQPLAAEVAESVAQNLTLHTGLLAVADAGNIGTGVLRKPTLRVKLQVLRMDAMLTETPGIDDQFVWTITCGESQGPSSAAAARSGVFSASPLIEAGPVYARLAQAHAKALADLSQVLAQALPNAMAQCTPR